MDWIFMDYVLLLYYCQAQARVDIFVIVYVKIVGQRIFFYWGYKSPCKNIFNHIATTEDAQIGRNIYWQSEMALVCS